MLELFTEAARTVMIVANREAERFHHKFIAEVHVVAGLLADGAITTWLNAARADVQLVRSTLERHLETPVRSAGRAKRIIESAIGEARQRGHSLISVEHIAMALLADSESTLQAVLIESGVDVGALRTTLGEALDRLPVTPLRDSAFYRSKFAELDALRDRPDQGRD